jgi:DNA replication protein DnaC
MDKLFKVFSQRYERGSTIVTSNLSFDEWTGVFFLLPESVSP